jgi:hypothetical protein
MDHPCRRNGQKGLSIFDRHLDYWDRINGHMTGVEHTLANVMKASLQQLAGFGPHMYTAAHRVFEFDVCGRWAEYLPQTDGRLPRPHWQNTQREREAIDRAMLVNGRAVSPSRFPLFCDYT